MLHPPLILGWLLVLQATPGAAPSPRESKAPPPPPRLEVGDPAPALRIDAWMHGTAPPTETGAQPIWVLCFVATWSTPSREALPSLEALHARFGARGVMVAAISSDDANALRAFLDAADPKPTVPIGHDDDGATTAAFCEAAAVGFLPYAFVLDRERRIAWHGHPRQPELATVVEQLLSGTYNPAAAKGMVARTRDREELEALFQAAYEQQAWQAALLALDALLETAAPRPRVLRHKLAIVLGELQRTDEARALVDEIMREFRGDVRALNQFAWDVVSDPRLHVAAPDVALRLARAAYDAGRGQDAAAGDTYARALYVVGRVDAAIRVQQEALALADDGQRPRLTAALEFYQRCRAASARPEARPPPLKRSPASAPTEPRRP